METGDEFIKEMVNNATYAGLTCTANTDKLNDPKYDCVDFLKRRIEQGHESIIEHINLSFEIRGISRALLQELARHRHISLSVESTRWTLGKTMLKKDNTKALIKLRHAILNKTKQLQAFFNECEGEEVFNFSDFGKKLFDDIERACNALAQHSSRPAKYADIIKYFLPELTPTNLVMTCNLRELRHIYRLRSKPPALQEFQDLCAAIKATLPPDIVTLLEVENNANT